MYFIKPKASLLLVELNELKPILCLNDDTQTVTNIYIDHDIITECTTRIKIWKKKKKLWSIPRRGMRILKRISNTGRVSAKTRIGINNKIKNTYWKRLHLSILNMYTCIFLSRSPHLFVRRKRLKISIRVESVIGPLAVRSLYGFVSFFYGIPAKVSTRKQ